MIFVIVACILLCVVVVGAFIRHTYRGLPSALQRLRSASSGPDFSVVYSSEPPGCVRSALVLSAEIRRTWPTVVKMFPAVAAISGSQGRLTAFAAAESFMGPFFGHPNRKARFVSAYSVLMYAIWDDANAQALQEAEPTDKALEEAVSGATARAWASIEDFMTKATDNNAMDLVQSRWELADFLEN